jgi:regulator of cell morphogenesis and NO signaling
LRDLIRQIVDKHHAYLHAELPALEQLAGKVAGESTNGNGPLIKLHGAVQRLRREMELQMRKEEAILFPAISVLEATVEAGGRLNPSPLGSVSNLSRAMEQDHGKTARVMAEIREIIDNYRDQPGDHPAIAVLFRRLRDLTLHMQEHVHLENDVLFPRAVIVEQENAYE